MVMSLICGNVFSAIAEEAESSGMESTEAQEALTEGTAQSGTEAYQSGEMEETQPPQSEEAETGIPEPVRNEWETTQTETESSTEKKTSTESETSVVTEASTESLTEKETSPETEKLTEGTGQEEGSTEAQTPEEQARPEFTYRTALDGIEVAIYAPEGILPEGTTVTVEPLGEDVLENVVQSITDLLAEEKEIVQLVGFDICFFDPDGKELHDLDGKVEVTYSGIEIPEEAEEAQVFHADEEGNITNTLMEAAVPSETVEFASDQFSPVVAAFSGAADSGISTLSISGDKTVAVGETITLSSNYSNPWYTCEWSTANSSIASIELSDGQTAMVRGVSPGTVTISYGCSRWGHFYGDTYTIEVTGNEGAIVYFLLSPTSDPDSNATNQWGSAVQPRNENAMVNTTGAVWTGSEEKNIFKKDANLTSYIISWPDGSQGSTWTLTDKTLYATAFKEVYNNYRTELENTLGITDLKQDDIEEITLIPYKISRNNSSSPDKHIDCTISVKCKRAYVARFNVWWPGDADYTNVSAENKRIDFDEKGTSTPEKIFKYSGAEEVPETKVGPDGITYRFDGWYNKANDKVTEDRWPYIPDTDELADGMVNFYAKYVPAYIDIKVAKKVTGSMGDKTKSFQFTYSFGDKDSEKGSFPLTDGGTTTISNVPIDAVLTLTETNASDYITTAFLQ